MCLLDAIAFFEDPRDVTLLVDDILDEHGPLVLDQDVEYGEVFGIHPALTTGVPGLIINGTKVFGTLIEGVDLIEDVIYILLGNIWYMILCGNVVFKFIEIALCIRCEDNFILRHWHAPFSAWR